MGCLRIPLAHLSALPLPWREHTYMQVGLGRAAGLKEGTLPGGQAHILGQFESLLPLERRSRAAQMQRKEVWGNAEVWNKEA